MVEHNSKYKEQGLMWIIPAAYLTIIILGGLGILWALSASRPEEKK